MGDEWKGMLPCNASPGVSNSGTSFNRAIVSNAYDWTARSRNLTESSLYVQLDFEAIALHMLCIVQAGRTLR